MAFTKRAHSMTIARIFVLQLVIAWVTRIMKKTSVQFARILITPTIIPFYEWKRIKKLWFQNEDSIQSWKYIRHCFSKHDPKTDKYHILARPTRIMKKNCIVQCSRILIIELERIAKLWFQNEDSIQSWKYVYSTMPLLSKHVWS